MQSARMKGDSPAPHTVVRGIDYVELFVGNVRQASHYYHTVWGFRPVALRSSDTPSTDRTSIMMQQGDITLVLTGAIAASSPVAEYLHLHGEGVAAVGLVVDDVERAYRSAVKGGATPVTNPLVSRDQDGEIASAEIQVLGGFTHTLVERSAYRGCFFPGFRALPPCEASKPIFAELDHLAVAVEAGTLDTWVDFYKSVFGFEMIHKEDVATEQTGMKSKVVQDPSGVCKLPLVEPVPGKRKSQVQNFLDFNNGPGIQHLALQTRNIVESVSLLREHNVEFLKIPSVYYDTVESRVGSVGEDLARLRDLGILVDHDEWGRLLQIFARPSQDRPTLFFEIIERRGARGFGGGNIRALFESIEREQSSRGGT
jgi:4-hydroxyphenylpyruvate dioxygenase